MTGRVPGWERVLAETLADLERTPFVWGRCDCALAICTSIAAVTGRADPGQSFRGRYKTAQGALGRLKRFLKAPAAKSAKKSDWENYLERTAEALAAKHGFAEIAPTFAQRGDLVLIRAKDGVDLVQAGFGCALGICAGAEAVFKCGPEGEPGLARAALTLCDRAWRVK